MCYQFEQEEYPTFETDLFLRGFGADAGDVFTVMQL